MTSSAAATIASRLTDTQGLLVGCSTNLVPRVDIDKSSLVIDKSSLVAELHRHKASQLGERMPAGSERHDEDLVFAQPNGRPIDEKSDYDDWSRLLQAGGVRHVRLHDGRHTAATLLLSEIVSPAGGHGAARPQPNAHHDGHLQPRHAGPRS
jgi:integrase